MKLIVVDRSKVATFMRLKANFVDDRGVRVIMDRRHRQIRQRHEQHLPERRRTERRRLAKTFDGRDYIVIHDAADSSAGPASR